MQENSKPVWCLLGKKAGDNTQVMALAKALGEDFEEKHIQAHAWELLVHLGHGATLAGIDQGASSPLTAPWPELVISAGRRNEPVAQWIRRQSGGRTRLVHIGRPWAPLDSWDLIVTTPQYFLPRRRNILHNTLPLHDFAAEQLRTEAQEFIAAHAHLPRPWIALLVGGDSGPFVLTPDKGAMLGDLADRLAAATRGSLLVSDSPRTHWAVGDAITDQLHGDNFVYRWDAAGHNPYREILGAADAFIVTGESMSMLAEAAAMDKPLLIFDSGDGATPWWKLRHNYRYKPLSHHLAMALGPKRMLRDVGNIQRALYAAGRARRLRGDRLGEAVQYALGYAPEGGRDGPANLSEVELQASADALRRLLQAR
ncbi:mitochondrial fission ELM1 family protein [Haliea sp. E17]|uniref:mitochondrial fission ELM1 family protein n=1 Tax=Haliea sp. E17 TaxID=3401576 RepID=UPI003AAB3826